MAERSIAAVLKTVDCNRSGGSNPSLSAGKPLQQQLEGFFNAFRRFCGPKPQESLKALKNRHPPKRGQGLPARPPNRISAANPSSGRAAAYNGTAPSGARVCLQGPPTGSAQLIPAQGERQRITAPPQAGPGFACKAPQQDQRN